MDAQLDPTPPSMPPPPAATRSRTRVTTGGVVTVAVIVTTVLAAFGGRYGFHRDELYFIEAGLHPAWGYPDQPSLVPLLAAAWHTLVGGSLWAFRLIPAIAAGLVVVVGSATSAELGASRRDQTMTAVLVGVDTLVIVTGHLFSTTTFDVLMTATVIWLLLRALTAPAGRDTRRWLLVGVTIGVALNVKLLLATVLAACVVAIVLVGPRTPLRRSGPWVAGALALVIITPHLVWQAANRWPQLELSSAIAAGSSGTSVDRWLVLPLQVVQHGFPVAAVMLVGIVALLRRADLRRQRWWWSRPAASRTTPRA
jgi:4-amino-4-deoxy-L-arabinose transferase-like glycosyltransferase